MNLVLSLFPGIGMLDAAFEQEGFCVVRGPDVLWGGDIRRFDPPAGKFDGVIGGPPCQAFSSLAHLVRANGYEPRFGNLIPEFERCVAETECDWFVMENVRAAPEPVVEGYGTKSFLLDNSWLPGEGLHGQEQRRVRRFTFGLRGREAPSLMKWIDVALLILPDATDTVTQWTPDNTPEAKCRQSAVLSTTRETPVAIGGSGKRKRTLISHPLGDIGNGSRRSTPGAGNNGKGRYRLADACRLQGLPEDFLADAPFTADGKLKAVANGVPLPMGRAIARAVKEALTTIPQGAQ